MDKTNLNNPTTSNQTCRYLGVYSCMLCKFRDQNFDPPQITNFWWGICMNVHFHVLERRWQFQAICSHKCTPFHSDSASCLVSVH